jgi:hypothetical protein
LLGFGALAGLGLADQPTEVQPDALSINRTNAVQSRTVTFGAGPGVTIARTNLPLLRGVSFGVPAVSIRDVTFKVPNRFGVSRTNLPLIRRINFAQAPLFVGGPFYPALCGPTDTTFGPQFYFASFDFIRAKIRQKEGDKARLTLTVKNPKVGPLTLPQWIWFSWLDVFGTSGTPGTVYPLFYGHLFAVPQSIVGETLTFVYIGEPNDAVQQLQNVAEGLKESPWYDPVWIDPAKRDDPTAIAETRTGAYHYSRLATPSSVSFSDLNVGEDGTLTFVCSNGTNEIGTVGYDSVKDHLVAPPLLAVRVEGDVSYRQNWIDIVDMGTQSFVSYMGNTLYDQWGKPGQQLGGGISVWSAQATDVYQVHATVNINTVYNYRNQETVHTDGDTMSISMSMTYPLLASPSQKFTISDISIGHVLDPTNGINTPTTADITYLYAPEWTINTSLQLRCAVNRVRKETFGVTLIADVQPVLGTAADSPLASTTTETIIKHGADVGSPLAYPLNWSSVAGKSVLAGTLMFPNFANPTLPGAQSIQVCLTAGTAGVTEPAAFSDVVGTSTTDGTVAWVSLGLNPDLNATDWTPSTTVPPGKIICPLQPNFLNYQDMVTFGNSQDPPIGTDVALFQIVQVGNTYFQATLDGKTNQNNLTSSETVIPPSWDYSPGATTNDGTVVWTCVGPSLPNGGVYYLAVGGGLTSDYLPNFPSTAGGTESDNGVVWMALGACPGFLPPPVGGNPGRIVSPTFFGTSYGQNTSAPYLTLIGRARLVYRARCWSVAWDTTWDDAIQITLRKNAQLYDDRINGLGTVSGKITEYEIEIDGPKTLMKGRCWISAAIGYGGTFLAPPGYVALPSGDCALVPPTWVPNDDGLSAPLTKSQITLLETVHGDAGSQLAAMAPAIAEMQKLAKLTLIPALYGQSASIDTQIEQARTPYTLDRLMTGQEVWYELRLKPVAGSTFTESFEGLVTNLTIPQQLNISD